MNKWSIILGIMVGLSLGISIYLFVQHVREPNINAAYHTIIDSLKSDMKTLQAQQQDYSKSKDSLRQQINQLKKDRIVLQERISSYTRELTSIKNEYAKIPAYYRDLSVDSTTQLFNSYFNY